MGLRLRLPDSLLVSVSSRASFDTENILDTPAQEKLDERGSTSTMKLWRLQGWFFTRSGQKLLVPMSHAVFPGRDAGFLVKKTGEVAVG